MVFLSVAETPPAPAANDCSESETWTRWVLFNEGKTEPRVSGAQQSHGLKSKNNYLKTKKANTTQSLHQAICWIFFMGEILQLLFFFRSDVIFKTNSLSQSHALFHNASMNSGNIVLKRSHWPSLPRFFCTAPFFIKFSSHWADNLTKIRANGVSTMM